MVEITWFLKENCRFILFLLEKIETPSLIGFLYAYLVVFANHRIKRGEQFYEFKSFLSELWFALTIIALTTVMNV